jgi:hypothetical protein
MGLAKGRSIRQCELRSMGNLSYWSANPTHEAHYLKEIFPAGLTPSRHWPSPVPPAGCKFAVHIEQLDFFLLGIFKNDDLQAYQKLLPANARIIPQTSRLDLAPELKLMFSNQAPKATPIELLETPSCAPDDGASNYLNEILQQHPEAEPGAFTIDQSQLLAKNKKLFKSPYFSFFKFLDQYLGVAGATQFETDSNCSLLSTIHSATFDGDLPELAALSSDAIFQSYLNGQLNDPSTWAAAICLAIREIPEVQYLKWRTPFNSYTITSSQNLQITTGQDSFQESGFCQKIEIKWRHRFMAKTVLLWSNLANYPSFKGYPKWLSPNPIIAVEGTADFPDKASIKFDQSSTEPHSLIINELGAGRLIFHAGRCPIHLSGPLPCEIHVFGAKIQSDLQKQLAPSKELVDQILRQAAPLVYQALSRLSAESDQTPLAKQFRFYLDKNYLGDEEAPYLRDQMSTDILLSRIALSSWSGETQTVAQWRQRIGDRLILAGSNQASLPEHIDPAEILKIDRDVQRTLRFLLPNLLFSFGL